MVQGDRISCSLLTRAVKEFVERPVRFSAEPGFQRGGTKEQSKRHTRLKALKPRTSCELFVSALQ